MLLTIIKDDNFISIDGNGLLNIEQDLSWIPDDVHALQWYGDYGEVEYKDYKPNLRITELGIYEQAIVDHENEIKRIKDIEILIEKSTDYLKLLRDLRNDILQETDWTQLTDVQLSEEEINSWRIYRQELRDLTDNIEDPKPLVLDPDHPSWPVKPY
jgi:hypothetical protein